jgi:hypothetical protein
MSTLLVDDDAEELVANGAAVIGEHDVADRLADLEIRPGLCRQTQCKGKGIVAVPHNLGDWHRGVGRVHRIEELPRRIDPGRDGREPNRPTLRAIGVLLLECRRADRFLKHEDGVRFQCGVRTTERRARGAARQTATKVAPGVERQTIEIGEEIGGARRLEGDRAVCKCVANVLTVGHESRRQAPRLRQQQRALRKRVIRRHPHVHPGACIAAFVQLVVDEPRMPSHRDAVVRGGQIRFVRDRVLTVREVVGRVGEQLHQGDAGIGGRSLAPSRREQTQTIEHQSSEARIVLRQVIDVGVSGGVRRADRRRRTVEVRRALHLEGERDGRQPRIEPTRRLIAPGVGSQVQRVAREIAEHLGANDERARQIVDAVDQLRVDAGRQVVGRTHPFDRDRGQPLAAVDQHVVVSEYEPGPKEPYEQRPLTQRVNRLEVIAHLEELDAVRRP